VAPRLRFAPSPTGSLHLGNARTALVNWLVARATGGSLVLRIEDTDVERNVPGAEQRICDDLAWLGVDWDEGPEVGGDYGPYRQSERRALYADAIAALLESGAAYHCFEDAETVRSGRAAAAEAGIDYAWPGRALDAEKSRRRVAAGEPAVVRLRGPAAPVEIQDGLRGTVTVGAEQVGDIVLARADGSPTYQLAVVVDDRSMAITHVVRGQDHLANTPGQVVLYEALGWQAPEFTHLPLVLGEDRSRLSKRHGATSVAAMRKRGILGPALANYLVLLGWAPPDEREIQRLDEIAGEFALEQLSATNVVFDPKKLDWVNQQHLQLASPAGLLEAARPFLAAAGLEVGDGGVETDWWHDALTLLVPAAHRLEELPGLVEPLFWRPQESTAPESERELLAAVAAASRRGELRTADGFRAAVKEIGKRTGRRGRELFHPLRVHMTGQETGSELAGLVPLIERGAGLELRQDVPSVAERLEAVLGASG
jgi:glutamyl-tRNA synthetase/nondiscriminating glutamyl-tRNA synthetase